jgi:hypothetical protein
MEILQRKNVIIRVPDFRHLIARTGHSYEIDVMSISSTGPPEVGSADEPMGDTPGFELPPVSGEGCSK